MKSSKFKRQRKRSKPTDPNLLPKPKKSKKLSTIKVTERKTQFIQLSETDRVTYMYGIDSRGNILEVTVSYDIRVKNNWETVKLYDNTHDLNYLHRHTKIAPSIEEDIISTVGVRKKGSPHNWLTWCIDDIKARYRLYKSSYLRRTKRLGR